MQSPVLPEDILHIRIHGDAIKAGQIPIPLLVSVLSGIQNTIYTLATARLRDLGPPAKRATSAVRESFELVRLEEKPGSYGVYVGLLSPRPPLALEYPDKPILQLLLDFIASLGTGNERLVDEVVGNVEEKPRLLRQVKNYAPTIDDSWAIDLSQPSYRTAELGPKTRDFVVQILSNYNTIEGTLGGNLQRLKLDKRRAGIGYEVGERVLEFKYENRWKKFLIGHLGHNIHVTGLLQLDDEGEPKRIIRADVFTPMDLSVVHLDRVTTTDATLLFRKPLILVPEFNGREIVLEVPELGLRSYGDTKDQALIELAEDMVWMWGEYALAPDDVLGQDAIALKKILHGMVKEARVR